MDIFGLLNRNLNRSRASSDARNDEDRPVRVLREGDNVWRIVYADDNVN